MATIFNSAYGIAHIIAEASSESFLCQQAIIASIRNRVRSGRFRSTIAGCCMQRYQYSEDNDDAGDNANLERALNLPDTDPQFTMASLAYDKVVNDENYDPSNGATHFFSEPAKPYWAKAPARETVVIGHVHFWADVP